MYLNIDRWNGYEPRVRGNQVHEAVVTSNRAIEQGGLFHADNDLQELTWQTHMLKSSYFADMKSQVGRYVDQRGRGTSITLLTISTVGTVMSRGFAATKSMKPW
jgi:hypothetical protein